MRFFSLLNLLLMFLLYSCENIFHPDAEIPSYINIEKIDLEITDPYLQGTVSHKITDAWVFVDDELQGIYELPVTFPVLKTGRHFLKIKAGIKDNGISATREQYPFFDFYTASSFEFFADSIVNVNPVVMYSPAAEFPWIEDFEDPGITIDSVYPSSAKIKRVTDNSKVFEGNASGFVSLDASNTIFKGISNASFALPKGGTSVYLELNYKTTVNMKVIVVSNNPAGTAENLSLVVTPTNKSGAAEWNKIYVNIGPEVSGNSNASDYKIIFYSDISEEGLTSAEIYLDNIKLVHF